MPQTGYIRLGSSGCLLPLLIILNLFFGKLIFTTIGLWLGVEVVLVLIFALQIKLAASRIGQLFKPQDPDLDNHKPPRGKIIDVQGQEIKDE
jgi:hypothetical protein